MYFFNYLYSAFVRLKIDVFEPYIYIKYGIIETQFRF